MKLKKIYLKNIRSYEEEEIEFSDSSTVLAGDIGSGKTSVLLGIEFALFGLQPGQRGNSLLRSNTEEGLVRLEIEVDNKKIIIERGLKRGKSVNQSYASLEIDNEKKEMSVTELKTKVLEILNYPKEFAKKTNILYRFTVYTPQEEMKQIILETPEIRLNTLRHIFGIDKYKRIRENAAFFTIKLREKIRNYEGQITDLENIKTKLQEKKENLEQINKKIKQIAFELKERFSERFNAESQVKEVEDKIQEKQKFEKEIEKTQVMLAGKKELLLSLDSEISSLLKQIQEAEKIQFKESELNNLKYNIEEKEKSIDNKNKLYMEILSKINSLNSQISEKEKSKENIFSLRLCPTCFQDVSSDYKKNIIRKFEEEVLNLIKQTDNFKQEKEDLLRQTETLKKELFELRKKLDSLNLIKIKLENINEKRQRLLDLEKRKTASEKDLELLEKQIEILRISVAELRKYDLIYETRKKLLDEKLKQEKQKEIEIASTEKEKQMTQISIQDLELQILNKEKLKRTLSEIIELESWLSTSFLSIISLTERNIMLKLREEFSKLFNEWFNILVPEIFTVRLDEDFTPIIEQQDFELDYSFLSGGERTAIALAYRMALNQVINSLLSKIKTKDLVILDEPTEGFSEQQLDKMRDVLNELKVSQLIIVSHESKIESFVDNIIKFKKEAGVTKVEK